MARSILFDPAFLRSLEGLRILARRVPAGGRHGEQNSLARGSGVEFTDVRPYVPGDDFRTIDWHLYQRLDKVFVRLFLQEQDLPVYILLDQSRSMGWQPPDRSGAAAAPSRPEPSPDANPIPRRSRSFIARRAVAALGYVALNHLDRAAVQPFAADEGGDRPLPPLSGKRRFPALLRWLEDLAVDGRTALPAALARLRNRRLRRGLVVVVSDFLDPGGAEPIARALMGLPHRLLLVRPVHPGEQRPDLRGAFDLRDCETGNRLDAHLDDGAMGRYEAAWHKHDQTLRAAVRRRGGSLVHLRTDRPVVSQLLPLFPGGTLRP